MPWSCETGKSCVVRAPRETHPRTGVASTSLSACKEFTKNNTIYTHFADYTEWVPGGGGFRCQICNVPLKTAFATNRDTRLCHWQSSLNTVSLGSVASIVAGSFVGVLLLCGLLYFLISRPGNGPSARPLVIRRAGFASIPENDDSFEAMPRLNLRV